jgi:hypothetical protein
MGSSSISRLATLLAACGVPVRRYSASHGRLPALALFNFTAVRSGCAEYPVIEPGFEAKLTAPGTGGLLFRYLHGGPSVRAAHAIVALYLALGGCAASTDQQRLGYGQLAGNATIIPVG